MVLFCPFSGRKCVDCEHSLWDEDKQRKCCYYGQPDIMVHKAKKATIEHEKRYGKNN